MDKLGYIGINRPVNFAHDFNGYTEEEIWAIISQKINILTEHFNYIDKKLEHEKEYNKVQFNYLLNDGLDKSVSKELLKKVNNDTFSDIISKNVLKNVNDKIDNLNFKINYIIKRLELLENEKGEV